MFAIGCLFIAFEEISWGQRLFDIPTPRVLELHNNQKELNLHNVAGRYILHGSYIVSRAYGAFAFLSSRGGGDDTMTVRSES